MKANQAISVSRNDSPVAEKVTIKQEEEKE